MAAATKERNYSACNMKAPSVAPVLKLGITIWAGAIAVQVSGKAQPYVAGTAGQNLLGISPVTYVGGVADTTYPPGDQMVFQRGRVNLLIDTTNPVTQSFLGKKVRLLDDSTVDNQTIGANDLGVTLRKIEDGMAFCDVE